MVATRSAAAARSTRLLPPDPSGQRARHGYPGCGGQTRRAVAAASRSVSRMTVRPQRQRCRAHSCADILRDQGAGPVPGCKPNAAYIRALGGQLTTIWVRHAQAPHTANASTTKLAAQASRNRSRDCRPAGCDASRSIADRRGGLCVTTASVAGTRSAAAAGGSSVGGGGNPASRTDATGTGDQSPPHRAQRTTRPAVTNESGTS